MNYNEELEKLRCRLERMKEYCQLKQEEGDWHGVADAAMDIREIVTAINVYERLASA